MMNTLIVLVVIALSITGCDSIKCEQCDASQGAPCQSGECEGTYCTAFIVTNKATGARISVKKACASTSPTPSKEDGCVSDALPDGSENIRCGCKSEDSCNSESGLSRMVRMLSNPSAPSSTGGASVNDAGVASSGVGGLRPGGGQQPNSLSPISPGLVNPNSSFTDVVAGQPTPFPGSVPNSNPNAGPGLNQPSLLGQPSQPGAGAGAGAGAGSGLSNGVPVQPLGGGPNSAQVPSIPANGSQQPFPQGGSNAVPPGALNPNKPPTPGQRPVDGGESGFGAVPNSPAAGGVPPDSNMVDMMHGGSGHNSSDMNHVPGGGDPRSQPPTNDLDGGSQASGQHGQTRNGAGSGGKSSRTCVCTEPSCNGRPCTGESCYMMTFSASDVHSPAFAGKQGQIQYSGCSNDPNTIPAGKSTGHRQLTDYKFKMNGQEISVPASAMYCNGMDYCNTGAGLYATFTAIVAGLVFAMAFVVV